MEQRVEAAVVDRIEVSAALEGREVRLKAKPTPEAGVVDSFLQLFSAHDLDLITAGTLSRKGFGTNYVDVTFDKQGAWVSATDYTTIVPEAAFDRLIARVSRAVIDAATKGGASITRESWWSQAVKDANAIIAKAYPKGL